MNIVAIFFFFKLLWMYSKQMQQWFWLSHSKDNCLLMMVTNPKLPAQRTWDLVWIGLLCFPMLHLSQLMLYFFVHVVPQAEDRRQRLLVNVLLYKTRQRKTRQALGTLTFSFNLFICLSCSAIILSILLMSAVLSLHC